MLMNIFWPTACIHQAVAICGIALQNFNALPADISVVHKISWSPITALSKGQAFLGNCTHGLITHKSHPILSD